MDGRGDAGRVRAYRRRVSGPSADCWQRKAEIGFGHLQGVGDEAAIKGGGVMAAVLPAGEHDPKGAAVGELVAVDAGTSLHSAHELALSPSPGSPCCCEPCRHASEAPFVARNRRVVTWCHLS